MSRDPYARKFSLPAPRPHGRPGLAAIVADQIDVRTLAGPASGQVSLSASEFAGQKAASERWALGVLAASAVLYGGK